MNQLYQQLAAAAPGSQTQLPQMINQKLSSSATKNNNNLLKSLFNSSDPSSFIQNMIQSNPKLKNLIGALQGSGMSPKQFFYQYAQQNGVDPDQFLNSLK